MTEYQCQKCGYRFESSGKPYACPYCGEIGKIKPTPTADDLINEISPRRKEAKETKKE